MTRSEGLRLSSRPPRPRLRLTAGGAWGRCRPRPTRPFHGCRSTPLLALLLMSVAAALRFWNLNHPNELVFDEVHFVGQGALLSSRRRASSIRHPPLAKVLVAVGIKLFGDFPWAWRLGVATMGTLLSGVTYMLGRRMFRSRARRDARRHLRASSTAFSSSIRASPSSILCT